MDIYTTIFVVIGVSYVVTKVCKVLFGWILPTSIKI